MLDDGREEPQLARRRHITDRRMRPYMSFRQAETPTRCRGQGRVQRRHRLSHRTGSATAFAKESAARPSTARSAGGGLGQRGGPIIDEYDLVAALDRKVLKRPDQLANSVRSVLDRNYDRKCEARYTLFGTPLVGLNHEPHRDSNGDDRAAKGKSQPGPQQRGFDACGCSAKYVHYMRVYLTSLAAT